MRTFTLIIATVMSLVAIPAMAFELERDAVIDLNLNEDVRDYFAASALFEFPVVLALEEKGWQCTSISSFIFHLSSRIEITCNRHQYKSPTEKSI